MQAKHRSSRGSYDLHGLSQSRAYCAWKNMRARCKGYQKKSAKDYKERGITYCKEWESFNQFLKDMGHPPEGMTLDRKDNDGNYEPSNCRWATRSQQQLNQREIIASNKSGVKGVCWVKKKSKWLVTFRGMFGGYFEEIDLAAAKRKKMEEACKAQLFMREDGQLNSESIELRGPDNATAA